MTDDGYRGYDINEEGSVIEYYDHRDEFQPAPVIERVPEKGSCHCCIGCMDGCQKTPTGSIVAFVFVFVGCIVWVVCGVLGLDKSTELFLDYGPAEGNPATDPPPEWIKGPGLYDNWRLVDPDKPGNYWPMVTERLKYCMYAISVCTVVFGIIMVSDGTSSTKEFRSTSRGCKSSSAGICCSVFLVCCSWVGVVSWALFLGFAGLGVYYYRMVYERCYDRFDRNFEMGVWPEICIDLVQLGVVQFKNTRSKAYGKICGDGLENAQAYGDLEGYCEHYMTPYGMMIAALCGAGVVMIGYLQFSMSLSSNYALLQKKYSRPMRKHREAVVRANQSVNGDVKKLAPPRMAPAMPGVHAPSHIPSHAASYAQPYDQQFEETMELMKAPTVRSDQSVDYYYKRY